MSEYLSPLWALLIILGALGLFLFGMKVLSEGVQKVAGQRMRTALAVMTRNRLTGIATGFFTSTLVQSSSATTVLVVSFVNTGLLTLLQAISLIMGANLGTTTTAWIVALVGKFSVSDVALPLIGIGIPLLFIGKDRVRNWGEVLIGLGLVFFGLGELKDSVPDLHTMMETEPEKAKWIGEWVSSLIGHGFLTVLAFLIFGIVLTLCVQSSSAAMAITIMLALGGWLGNIETDAISVFRNSAAIVLGENIGTTVTAWLAALPANAAAKRAARAHFLFNVIGVAWCLVLFYPFSDLVWKLAESLPQALRSGDDALQSSEIAFGTAIFHSLFNLTNILLLAWFAPQIARVVEHWVKNDKEAPRRQRLTYISSRQLDLGELNLVEAEKATEEMADTTLRMFDGFCRIADNPEDNLSQLITEMKQLESDADEMLHDITVYLVECSTREIGTHNSGRIATLLRYTSELEEATDRMYRLIKITQKRYEKDRVFGEEQREQLRAIRTEVRTMLTLAVGALNGASVRVYQEANRVEDIVDKHRKTNNREAAGRMKNGADVATELIFIEMNNHLEAIANHALNLVQVSVNEGEATR